MGSPHLIAGKYELLRKIASGGMAEVYLAKQTGLVGFEKLVVIKQILPHLSENDEFVRMFLDEARTAADLRHPNVVQIYEVGKDQGTFFIAMEFLHGQDLRRILRRQIEIGQGGGSTRVPLQHALQIVIDAAAGLHYAHQKADLQGRQLSIIHRDISPQNIIVTYDGATKIVDFGIAKAASQSTETRSGVLKGKYSYMSPEQASGDQIDQRTDQFALGIVAYELTTSTRLFKYPNEIMTLHAIIECRITPPADVVRGYPPDLNAIMMRALAKDREDRFPDLAHFVSDLEEFMAREGMVHSPQRVSGYMQEVFKDDIEQEAQLGHPLIAEEASGPSDIARATARKTGKIVKQELEEVQQAPTKATVAGRSRTGAGQRYDMAATTTDVPPGPSESGMTSVVARLRSRLGISLAAALALLALVGVAIWYATKPTDAIAAQGRITVNTDPQGATVYVDGLAAAGKTPTVISNLPVGKSVVIKVELFGYEPQQKEVLAIEGRPVEFSTALTKSSGNFASVRFVSTPPGAKVYIDGAPQTQVTPFELGRLKVGDDHTAAFTLEGYENATKKFKVGEEAAPVSVELVKLGGATPALPDAAIALKPDAATAPPPVVDGKLDLDSTPRGVLVLYDGKELGTTPLKALPFPPGEYTLKFVDEKRGIDEEQTITVVGGKLTKKAFKLTTKKVVVTPPKGGKGTLKVVVKGNWADVYVNGKKIGQTPIPAQTLEAGSYKIRLVNSEIGKDVVKTVKVEANKEAKVTEVW